MWKVPVTRTVPALLAAALVAGAPAAGRSQAQPNDLLLWNEICLPFIAAGATEASWTQHVTKLQGWGLRVMGSRDTFDASASLADDTEVSFSTTSAGGGGMCEVEPDGLSPQFRAEVNRFLKRHRAKETEVGAWVMSAYGTTLYMTVEDYEVSLQRQ
jgi:hypothetical protein